MDPLIWLLLGLFIGVPLLSVVVMLAFTATADFEPDGIEVRGGTLRGAIAGALAKILVGDAKTFQLPLVVVLHKIGIFGESTPLVGGATVRDIEWRILVDGEHVSTVTEASSVRIRSDQRSLRLPVNAEIHLPRGLVGTWRKYRGDRRAGREVRIEVRGHVIIKHWFMTRELPVRVTRHVVVGDALPHVDARWRPIGTEPANVAELEVVLENPYRDEVLAGPFEVAVLVHRRLRRDPVLATWQANLRLEPGDKRKERFQVRLVPGVRAATRQADVTAHEVHVRLRWADETLADAEEEGAEPSARARVRLAAAEAEEGPLVAVLDRLQGDRRPGGP